MSVIEHPDEKEVDDIGDYLRYITEEAEPAAHDKGYGFHGDLSGRNSKPEDVKEVNNE